MSNYVSGHTGSQIDSAVTKINAVPWKPLSKAALWVSNSDSGHSASYKTTATISFDSSYTSSEQQASNPFVWFVDGSGNRYYVDFVWNADTSTISVYSNTNSISGSIYVLGLVGASGIS